MNAGDELRTAVVIPCFRVSAHVLDVVEAALRFADGVFCVDDACPEQSGRLVAANFSDARVRVLYNPENLGVGGAVKAGYRAALQAGFDIVIKLDGDGQMDAEHIPVFLAPLLEGWADYSKGNRFYELEYLKGMPTLRLLGNSLLSFFCKLSSGYWRLLDPTNGYTAIHSAALRAIPLDKVSDRYFFESDMLFRLNIARAVVVDVPMPARYGSEQSNLKVRSIILPFLAGHVRNLGKRIFYTYFLRDFNIASLLLITGLALSLFGFTFGLSAWIASTQTGVTASAGTVMLAGMPALIGVQLLLSFLNYDIQNVPTQAISSFSRHHRWR